MRWYFHFGALVSIACSAPLSSPDAQLDTTADRDATGDGATTEAYPYTPLSEPGRHLITLGQTEQLVPGPMLPAGLSVDNSNNNLDVIRFEGRTWLAFRTSPDHFAGPETRIVVLSLNASDPTWRFETEFALQSDLREPRFLNHEGQLALYVSRLGTDPLDFQPGHVHVSVLQDDGWSTLNPVTGLAGAVLWRARSEATESYLVIYRGGEQIYDFVPDPMLSIEVYRPTSDFLGLLPVPNGPNGNQIYVGGGSEADFTFDPLGNAVGVVRMEAGDSSGWGSLVCVGATNTPFGWDCVNDPRKFDSPLVFAYDQEIYLVARRNVTPTGFYDVSTSPNPVQRQVQNQLDYWRHPKRCSLFRFVAEQRRFAFMLDLPSRGDTCFPAMLDEGDGRWSIYNYSSPLEGPDPSWREGQMGPTVILRTELLVSRRE